MNRHPLRRYVVPFAVAVTGLVAATAGVGYLQDTLGIPNPSAVYLVAVVAAALVGGSIAAIATSFASFLAYNYFFTEPRHTFAMNEPAAWLSVVLLLFVGVVVGHLVAVMRSRAATAQQREHEARAMFRVSRALATRESTATALEEIAGVLRAETLMSPVWITLGSRSQPVAHTDDPDAIISRPFTNGVVSVLRRMPADEPAQWVRVHQVGPDTGAGKGRASYQVRIEAGGSLLGSIWSIRERGRGLPSPTETRLLSAAADQIGQAVTQDRLATESRSAEVARQSDALKSALLQSVSHDLRSPLATIRARAGTLADDGIDRAARREGAAAIEREAEYLNRLVTNLLDLSRIEAGAMRAQTDAMELEDALTGTIERLRPRLGQRSLAVDLHGPVVSVDPVLLDEAVVNILENVVRHTPADAPVRISVREIDADTTRLTIEDGGAGVPDDGVERVFDKFYRGGTSSSVRAGTGIGLAVVRGFVTAMGGSVHARRSELGGLAIDIDLMRARLPVELGHVGAA